MMSIKRCLHISPKTTSKFLTDVSNPDKHSSNHASYFYKIPFNDVEKYLFKGLRKNFYRFSKPLNGINMMVRAPALEIISQLKEGTRGIKLLIYGHLGAGKTMTLANVIHWAGTQGWFVIKEPWPPKYCRIKKTEIQYIDQNDSTRIDQPLFAAEFLQDFVTMNGDLVSKYDLKTTSHRTWSKREETAEGTSLLDLIDFGLNRVKYAPEIMGVIIEEIRLKSEENKLKVLIAIEGVNSLFTNNTVYKVQDQQYKYYKPNDLTIFQQLKSCLSNHWTNGSIICTVDGHAGYPPTNEIHPHKLLGTEGFQFLEPFLPIFVPEYSDEEIYNTLLHYVDVKWLLDEYFLTQPGLDEIIALSARNPNEIMQIPLYL